MSTEGLNVLRDKLDEFKATLSEHQVGLLAEVLDLVGQLAAEGDDLGFDGSFEPDEAALILSYAGSTATPAQMIKGGMLHMIKVIHHP